MFSPLIALLAAAALADVDFVTHTVANPTSTNVSVLSVSIAADEGTVGFVGEFVYRDLSLSDDLVDWAGKLYYRYGQDPGTLTLGTPHLISDELYDTDTGGVYYAQHYLQSVSRGQHDSTYLFVSAKTSNRDVNCVETQADPRPDLEELRVNRATGAVFGTRFLIDQSNTCARHGQSFIASDESGTFHSCWTVGGTSDEVYCHDRPFGTPNWGTGSYQVAGNGTGIQDHSVVTVLSSGAIAVLYHNGNNASADIQLRQQDTSGVLVGSEQTTGNNNLDDRPYVTSVAGNPDTIHAIWARSYANNGNGNLGYSYCDAGTGSSSTDCTNVANPFLNNKVQIGPEVGQASPCDPGDGSLQCEAFVPQIASNSYGDLFVFYEVIDHDATTPQRVAFAWKCANVGSWESQDVEDPDSSPDALGPQAISEWPGKPLPAIAIDEDALEPTINLAYVELEDDINFQRVARWSHAPVSDFCSH